MAGYVEKQNDSSKSGFFEGRKEKSEKSGIMQVCIESSCSSSSAFILWG